MKILVIGHAGHGKDVFCDMLFERGFKYTTTSTIYMREAVWPKWKDQYESKSAAVLDRKNRRPELFQIIDTFNQPRDRLARLVLEESDIYCGMRSLREFEVSAPLFDLIVWIDGSKRKPLESAKSMQLTSDVAHLIIDNNGTLKELEQHANKLAASIRKLSGE